MQIQLEAGSYEVDLDSPLGRPGGFGAVYLGRRLEDGQDVAIKRFHNEGGGDREITVARSLMGRDAENVIPILDVGHDSDSGDDFIVMPIAQESLQDVLDREGSMSVDDAARVVTEVVKGLLSVPRIVHRDIKPANVLLHDGSWKLSDFGISRFADAETTPGTMRQFMSGPYAAPEQWEYRRPTTATDVYAIGVVLYELVDGNTPFQGPQPEDFRHQHLEEPPPDLQNAPPSIQAIVQSMLRKRPESRPTLSDISAALESMTPDQESAALGSLAEANAAVSAAEARREAEATRASARLADREGLASLATAELLRIMDALFTAIVDGAPVARVNPSPNPSVSLGDATLAYLFTHPVLREGSFPHSGWDVVVGGVIALSQRDAPNYQGRSSSLWYTNLGESDGRYRWIEVPYMHLGPRTPGSEPFFLESLDDADLAASNITHIYQHAAATVPIDDDAQAAFIDKWIERFAAASTGQLQRPSMLPE
jgi:serine/threonine-protein kinase